MVMGLIIYEEEHLNSKTKSRKREVLVMISYKIVKLVNSYKIIFNGHEFFLFLFFAFLLLLFCRTFRLIILDIVKLVMGSIVYY